MTENVEWHSEYDTTTEIYKYIDVIARYRKIIEYK